MRNQGLRKLSILVVGGKRKPDCHCPLEEMSCAIDIPKPVRHDLSEIIRESIDYGLAHREEAVQHSLPYARDMDAKLAGKFIGMYVNEFTRDYGEVGRDAIRQISSGGAQQRLHRRPDRSGIRRIILPAGCRRLLLPLANWKTAS